MQSEHFSKGKSSGATKKSNDKITLNSLSKVQQVVLDRLYFYRCELTIRKQKEEKKNKSRNRLMKPTENCVRVRSCMCDVNKLYRAVAFESIFITEQFVVDCSGHRLQIQVLSPLLSAATFRIEAIKCLCIKVYVCVRAL